VALGSRGSQLRCLLVWCAAGAGLALVAEVVRGPVRRLPASLAEPAPLDVVLTEVAALALLVCAAWLWVVTTAVVAGALRGERHTPAVPGVVRRWVLAACGVALVGSAAAPAHAADSGGGPAAQHHAAHLDRHVLAGLPLPDRTVAGRRPPAPAPVGSPRSVVVRCGDSLWSIAATDLGPSASDTRIAARWHEIYAANRHRIGPDPDVIAPGTRITLPGKDQP
jgi:nucleoid-associated protein YgaU